MLGACLVMSFQNAAFTQQPPSFPKGKITVRALDENGQPVFGAKVGITYSISTFGNPIVDSVEKTTGADGTVSGEGRGDGEVAYGAEKNGFYEFEGRYSFIRGRDGRPTSSDGTWQPWNPTFTATLKRIVKPVPLYARHCAPEIPNDAWPVGFDLVESDWVAPYGTGKVADFIFRMDRVIVSKREYSAKLQLTFSNVGDGIVAVPIRPEDVGWSSKLKLPQQAPATGYEPAREWQMYTQKRPDFFHSFEVVGEKQRGDVGYFFRVCTERDSQGNILRAMYGKIQPDVSFDIGMLRTAHSRVGFNYYLNPSGERDLEFDTKHNLFKLPRGGGGAGAVTCRLVAAGARSCIWTKACRSQENTAQWVPGEDLPGVEWD